MPIISQFYGIKIIMLYEDHNPPHFHVTYGEFVALITINDIKIIKGDIPKRALKMIMEWSEEHKQELVDNWELAGKHKKLNYIDPLK